MGFETALDILNFITNAVNIGYWLLAAAAMVGSFITLKGKAPIWGRILAALAIGGLLMSWPISNQIKYNKQKKERKAVYDAADAQFQMRCKSAGVNIYRTVDNVEGVLLMKLRPKWDPYDQNMIDPYGHDETGENYIKSFLARIKGYGQFSNVNVKPSYRYVDVIEPDGKRYRYTGYMGLLPDRPGRTEPAFMLKRTLAKGPAPRYGVTYDDITTPEERKNWIAGSSLRIIDLKTNEVIAERIGYMIDRGMGNNSGGRSPWDHAARWACPSFPTSLADNAPMNGLQTINFVEKVLKIRGH